MIPLDEQIQEQHHAVNVIRAKCCEAARDFLAHRDESTEHDLLALLTCEKQQTDEFHALLRRVVEVVK